MSDLITQEALMEATGYRRQAALERHLQRNGVQYFRGKDGQIWTTRAAIDHALLGTGPLTTASRVEFVDT